MAEPRHHGPRAHRPGALAGLAAIVALLAGPGEARADPFNAVLWVHPDRADARVVERVRGQLSDLELTLIEVGSERARSIGEQLAAADVIARRQAAQAVVWFDPLPEAGGGVLVVVADPRGGRVLVRRVGSSGPARAPRLRELDSATLEAAALVVRTALRGLAAGAVIGIERAEASASKPAAPAVKPAAPAALPASGPAVSRGFAAEVGWHVVHDGHAPQTGLTARLGYEHGRWRMGLLAAPSLGAELTGRVAAVRLDRRAFGAFAGLSLAGDRRLSLAVGLTAGAVLFHRTTLATVAGAQAVPPADNPAAFVGAEAALRWFPGGAPVGLWLIGGADGVPGAPILGHDAGGRFVASWPLWKVQPHVAAGVAVATF